MVDNQVTARSGPFADFHAKNDMQVENRNDFATQVGHASHEHRSVGYVGQFHISVDLLDSGDFQRENGWTDFECDQLSLVLASCIIGELINYGIHDIYPKELDCMTDGGLGLAARFSVVLNGLQEIGFVELDLIVVDPDRLASCYVLFAGQTRESDDRQVGRS